ncbi:MAG: MaoC family dehydratase [Actinomycetota bacterium]|nr:MaoC family dehydratase [Actinomycetota bacterium]
MANGETAPTRVDSTKPRVVAIDDLKTLAGQHVGCSSWRRVTQEQIDAFANATDDHQWLHVDPVRARSGPFGLTIAHGYLTLSLLPALLNEVLVVSGVSMVVNYGLNRVRFIAPVPSGSQVRLCVECQDVTEFKGGKQATLLMTVERESEERPACVAEVIFRFYR